MSIGAALAALSAGLGGYAKGKKEREEADYQRELRERERKKYQDEQALAQALKDAGKPIDVQQVATMTGLTDKPVMYDTPEEAAQSQAGFEGAGVKTEVTPGFRAGAKTYATMDEANKAVQEYNSEDAQAKRLQTAYMSAGQADKALSVRASGNQVKLGDVQVKEAQRKMATEIKKEGIEDAWRASMSGDPEAVRTAFNARGDRKIDGDIQVAQEIREVPGLGKISTFTYTGEDVDKDGNRKPFKVNSFDLGTKLFTFKDYLDLGEKAEKNRTENRRLDITENYYTGMLGINRDKVDGKNASLDDKMSDVDRETVRSLNGQIEKISAAITKAYAEGEAKPDEPSPGMRKLQKDLAALNGERRSIIDRYQQNVEKPDPAGFGSNKAPSATPSASSVPAAPASAIQSSASTFSRKLTKDQQAALDKDIPMILERERQAVLKRIEAGDERAKADLASLDREIARLAKKGGAPAAARPAPSMVDAVQAPGAAQVTPLRKPELQPAAADPANPIDAAGLKLDMAKKVFAQASAEAQKYGLMQRRADPAGFERAMQALQIAREAMDKQRVEYQALIEKQMRGAAPAVRYANP